MGWPRSVLPDVAERSTVAEVDRLLVAIPSSVAGFEGAVAEGICSWKAVTLCSVADLYPPVFESATFGY